MKFFLQIVCVFTCCSSSVFAQVNTAPTYVGTGVEYQFIGDYSTKELNQALTADLQGFLSTSSLGQNAFKDSFPAAKYAVKVYRVIYKSVIPELDNRPTIASGLVAIPQNGANSMPLLSYQHGMTFTRKEAPSFPENSLETRMMLARYAAQGYVVIAPDYFGKGLSVEPDSYLIKASTQQACADMLFAAKDMLASLQIKTGALFLAGWSQGGWATLAFLQKLESLNITVAAVATACATGDVALTLNRYINNWQPIDASSFPAVVSIQLQAHEYYYQRPGLTATAIKPVYLKAAKAFFNGSLDFSSFLQQTTNKLQDFLNPDFITTGDIANNSFWQTLNNSEAYRWRSHTPMYNYYGEMDEAIPTYVATLPAGYHNLLGCGPTTAISAGSSADHRGTFIFSLLNGKKWFDAFLKK